MSTVKIMTPRKPNSAKRKYVKVGWYQPCGFFFTAKKTFAHVYISGELRHTDFEPKKSGDLLIRGGRVKDLPGMKLKAIRGYNNALKGLTFRKRSRSKYGTPNYNLTQENRIIKTFKTFKYYV